MKSEAIKPTIVRIHNEPDEINRIWRSYIRYRWKTYFQPNRSVLTLLTIILFFTLVIVVTVLPMTTASSGIICCIMLCLGYMRIKLSGVYQQVALRRKSPNYTITFNRKFIKISYTKTQIRFYWSTIETYRYKKPLLFFIPKAPKELPVMVQIDKLSQNELKELIAYLTKAFPNLENPIEG